MKKFIYAWLVLCFCLFSASPSVAQNNFCPAKMDSLSKQLAFEKTAKDSLLIVQQLVDVTPIRQSETNIYPDRINLLMELNSRLKMIDPAPYQLIDKANKYWAKKQYPEALKCLKLAIDDFDQQHKCIVPLLMNMRILYNLMDDQNARLLYYQQKLNYYLVNGPVENAAPCYHSIAYYYYIKGAFNQCLSIYLKGAAIFRQYDAHYYANSISVIGKGYSQWGNIKKGRQYLNYILPIAERIGDTNALGAAYDGLALTAALQKDYKGALAFINKDIQVQHLISQHTASNFAIKAQMYLKLQQPDLALPVLEKAKALADSGSFKTVNNFNDMEVDYDYYLYYLFKGNFKKAEESLLTALKNVTDQKGIVLQLKYLRELGDFYAGRHNHDLSEKYFKQYLNLSDTREQKLEEFKVAQYEIDQKDKEQHEHISQLKQEKAERDYQISRRNALLWSSLVVLLLISGLVVFIYRQLQINKKTLLTLRQTQTQLIQSEKMASLGELTAGIAHEIQNPLNFVNNFSEVNKELIEELELEIDKGDLEEIKAIASDIKENSTKINHHGKRADAIVKGMLEHSRAGSGVKELTDINKLADEYLRLSYHGLRSKNKSFNAEMVTHLDDKLPLINVIPQDIGRVMLNLFNNAFYAVNQKAKIVGPDYKPEVSITTTTENGQVLIKVKDNGIGIPEAIKEKIMQPFFTTKPTGEGTGLGLSLTYDMVVKGHGGTIAVASKEGEGSEFIITLPIA